MHLYVNFISACFNRFDPLICDKFQVKFYFAAFFALTLSFKVFLFLKLSSVYYKCHWFSAVCTSITVCLKWEKKTEETNI